MNGRNAAAALDLCAVAAVHRRRALGTVLALTLSSSVAKARAPASVRWPSLRLIDGREIGPEHWIERSALVVLWATWCPYCKRHNDRLNELYAARSETTPRVLTVAIDGDLASVRRHVAAQRWIFPVALDDGRLRTLFTERRTVPLTVLIGADGLVRQRIPGEMTKDDLQRSING